MRGRPPNIKEKDILDAARDVFRQAGHAATTANIAQRAGVSEGILFYRYKNKEGLLAAVIHRETQPSKRLLDIAKSAGRRSVAKNVVAIIEILLESAFRAHPFMELVETSPKSKEIRQQLMEKAHKPPPQRIVELLAEYFQAEIRLGRVRVIDTIPLSRAIFGGCIDYVRSCKFFSADEDDRQSFIKGLADVLLNGVVADALPKLKR